MNPAYRLIRQILFLSAAYETSSRDCDAGVSESSCCRQHLVALMSDFIDLGTDSGIEITEALEADVDDGGVQRWGPESIRQTGAPGDALTILRIDLTI